MKTKREVGKIILTGAMTVMSLLSIGRMTVYAAEDTIQTQETTQEVGVEETCDDNTECLVAESEEVCTEASNVATLDLEGTATEEEGISTETEEPGKGILLNYLVLERDYVETPSTQYVVASVGDENIVILDAVLTYTNVTTGTVYQQKADMILGGTLLFNLSFSSEQAGKYQIESLACTIDGSEYIISIPETGAVAVFGVNVEVDVEPYAWILDEKQGEVDIEIQQLTLEPSSGNNLNMNSITRTTADGKLVIVLDPGHGGTDPGATRTWNGVSYVERDINFKIAQYCKEVLETYDAVTVYMTRMDNSTTMSLTERTNFAKSVNADIFISLHINSTAGTSTTATGAEVIIPNASYNAEIHNIANDLGKIILDKLAELGVGNRGTWSKDTTIGERYPDGSIADYYTVIYNSKVNGMPGMIVEHAFISNESDCVNFLGTDEKLKQIGIQDALAIAEYYNLSVGGNYTYNGVDYSAVYDYEYYINLYPDLKVAYEGNPKLALEHFVNHGMAEGRQGSADFNVTYYKNRYIDLRNGFGNNLKEYYLHYMNHGKAEGRDGKTYCALQGAVTQLNGIDYSAVYDFEYYINKYSDVKDLYGDDDIGALQYFVTYGMKAGQQGNSVFNVTSYAYKYYDLRKVYRNDLINYYNHYINYGRYEGRVATDVKTMQGGPTLYNGTDYSQVFNSGYYANRYKDLQAGFALDDEAYLMHFVNNGMKEGRQGNAQFNVTSYRYQYQDLRMGFGMNLESYYLHYINNGKAEGRKGTGTTSLQNPVTVVNGVDYSAVYNYNYYLAKYADIRRAYEGDDLAVINHFVNHGMSEGRQGNSEFVVSYYKLNYIDLQRGYGENLKSYYLHYITNGKNENRIANELIGYNIMGTSTVTVEQMVRYYNEHATYPSYYTQTDAPDIRMFCQMYLDECNAEGVRAEVAFSQAMLETGFLSYGGDVSISQYNFAGLGATGGVPGLSFSSVQEGIRAQVQHLKAYASTDSLNNSCVDPRFAYVKRGSAPFVEWLGIKENPYGLGWATAKNYGYIIKDNYISSLLTY